MHGIIYRATNKLNGKKYIGKSMRGIVSANHRHYHNAFVANKTTKFYNAIRKHGWDNFMWDIVYSNIPKEQLSVAEICAIYTLDAIDSGYNLSSGGNGGDTFSSQSDERKEIIRKNLSISLKNSEKHAKYLANQAGKTLEELYGYEKAKDIKRKRSESLLGHPTSKETRKKIGDANSISLRGNIPWNKGLVYTEWQRRNLNKAHIGRKQPPELIEKRAAANRGRKRTPEQRIRMSLAMRGKKKSKPPWNKGLRKIKLSDCSYTYV